ncbi:MAG TPA: FAD-dependent oxidoreductase [Vitreimonas sp.]|nr:FAD-dependent oxidoreductase [Vitreimonas sp.]
MSKVDVVIVGSGLAGLSCARELCDRGLKVVILEQCPVVGGRTSSWNERGMHVESGLHRYLGFYRAMPELLSNCGLSLDEVVIWEDEMEIRTPQLEPAVFGMSPFFRPWQTVTSWLDNRHLLSTRDKASLLPFFLMGLKEYYTRPGYLDQFSVAEWADRYSVTAAALQRLLVPLTAGIFFLPPEQYSAQVLMGIVAQALPTGYKTRIGAFSGGMTEVMTGPIAGWLTKKGVSVITDAPVTRLCGSRDKITGVEVNGKKILAEQVVVATGLGPAQRLLTPLFKNHLRFKNLFALPTMAEINIQLELDSPALPVDRTTFGPGTSLACMAEQSRTTFRNLPGRLSIILSPAEKFYTLTPAAIFDHVVAEAKKLHIFIKERVTKYRVIKHPKDFYAISPGTDHLRPSQHTSVPGLVLAGDYTQQPWYCTMEGAVISGKKAAQVILSC